MLTACGNEKYGVYKLIELSDGVETYNSKLLKTLGIEYELELKDETSAVLKTDDETINLIYNDKEFIMQNINAVENKIPYEMNGNRITIMESGTKMVFEKK